jgi:hypothetical protein
MKIIKHSETPEITPNTSVRSSIRIAEQAVLRRKKIQTG